MSTTIATNLTTLTYVATTNLIQNLYPVPEKYEIIPYASYVAIACVVIFTILIIFARLVIRVDGQQSDLILFNKSPQKHLLLLVSKQLYNTTAAQNNIASAIANGLMEPPPNYDPSKIPTTSSNNAIKNIGMTSIAMNDISAKTSAKTSTTSLNSSVNRLEAIDTIEPTPKASSKRQKW